MNPIKPKRDNYGVKLKYPDRTCKQCRKYPCFEGIEICSSDFAKYGCFYYSEPIIDYDGVSPTSRK